MGVTSCGSVPHMTHASFMSPASVRALVVSHWSNWCILIGFPSLVSLPALGSGWTEWSHGWGGEMHLRKVLEKLNLEYPRDPDD